MSNKLMRGTFLLTGAALFSKVLGMIYVIPFNAIVGTKGGALYAYAYNPYTILLSISTVGVPLAVSRFVSKYNSLGDYRTSLRMFRIGLMIMIFTGITAFLILFFSSEWIASKFIVDDEHGNTVEDVKMVIRMVSFALIIIPFMSIFRGFFQGNQSMGPTAASQVVEQIIRIAFVLISGFFVIYVFKGTIETAVGFATFAAFIGAIASLIVLLLYWKNRKKHIYRHVQAQEKRVNIPAKDMIVELFKYAAPFVLVGIAIPLYQSVDSFTFNKIMTQIGQKELSDTAFAVINLYGFKLVIIPVTVATGLSLTIIPQLTESFTSNNQELVTHQINQALQTVLVLVIPAGVGLSALAQVAYSALYGMADIEITSQLLAWYAPFALFLALYTLTSAMLQGINEQRFAVISLFIGFFIKLMFNALFIQTFGAKGSILATGLAFGVAVTLNLFRIRSKLHFSFKQTFRRTLLILILTSIMLVVVLLSKKVFGLFIPYDESRLAAIVMLIIGVIIGGVVYLYLAFKTTLVDHVFGHVPFLNRFRRKKDASR